MTERDRQETDKRKKDPIPLSRESPTEHLLNLL